MYAYIHLHMYIHVYIYINIHIYTYLIYINAHTYVCKYMVAKTRRMPSVADHFRKRATNYTALLQKMTYGDKAPYDSTPPCIDIVASERHLQLPT